MNEYYANDIVQGTMIISCVLTEYFIPYIMHDNINIGNNTQKQNYEVVTFNVLLALTESPEIDKFGHLATDVYNRMLNKVIHCYCLWCNDHFVEIFGIVFYSGRTHNSVHYSV